MSKDSLGHLEAKIRTIIEEQFQGQNGHVSEIDVDTPLIGHGLGLDSLDALTLAIEIESEFDIIIDDDELTVDLFENIHTLAEHVGRKLSANANEVASG